MKHSSSAKLELQDSSTADNVEGCQQKEIPKKIVLLRDLRNVPLALRKQEALKPIYLVRYE